MKRRPKTKLCKDSKCKRKGKRLLLTEFPHNRKMKDGRFVYCCVCANRRTAEYRERQRAKKQAELALLPAVERKPSIIAPAFCRVYDAIRSGKRTRDEIQQETELDFDEIGEALCELVFEAKGVRIKTESLS